MARGRRVVGRDLKYYAWIIKLSLAERERVHTHAHATHREPADPLLGIESHR